jgi:AcrR family transcriptional regulator
MPSKHAGANRKARRGRPPGRTSDVTRERILAAACECFGTHGYETTTNRDIADRAGVTPAAMYQYFDSKLTLYMAAVREAQRQIVPLFREAVDKQSNTRAKFSALTRAYATAHERFPSVTPLLSGIAVEMQRHQEIATAMLNQPDEVLQMIIDIVRRGVEDDELPPEMASPVVAMFLASTMGLSLHAALTGQSGLAEAVEGYTRLVEGRLFRKSKAAPPARRRGSR